MPSLWWALLAGVLAVLAGVFARFGGLARFGERWQWRQRLKQGDVAARLSAIRELTASEHPERVELLTPLLRDAETLVKIEAVRSLGAIGKPKAIASLQPLLTATDDGVRVAAVAALGDIEDQQADSMLMRLLEVEHSTVIRASIEDALARIELEPRKAELDIFRFVAALRHDGGAYRRVAVETLLRLKPVEALEPLVDALADTSMPERIASALDEIDPAWRELPYVRDKVRHWYEALHHGDPAETAGIEGALREIERP